MTFTARTRAQIRTDLLSSWASRWTAAGSELDTRTGSFSYRIADVLALTLAPMESWAASLADQILPDTATTTYLDRHGGVEGLTRDPATAAVLVIRVNGTPSATVTFGSSQFVSPSGLRYRPSASSVGLNGSGYGDATFVCATLGTTGNLASSTVMTWDSTPTNATSSGTVQSTTTAGAAEETDASYASRIISRRQERPASGNRADWRDWVEAVTGVSTGYVYPLLHASLGPDTLGAVTVVCLGPVQGTSTTNTRILSGGSLANIDGYIEGTRDVDGNSVTGTMLRPATVDVGDYSIETAGEATQAVTIQLVMSGSYPFPWTPATTYVPTAYNDSTKEISFASDPVLVTAGDLIAVRETGAGASRGSYRYGVVDSVNHGTFKVTMTSAFSSTTVDTGGSALIRALPANASEMQTAVFDFFDSLGPGDSTGDSLRWPTEDVQGRATLYRTALAGSLFSVNGVLSASVTTPATDVTPSPKYIVTLGELVFTQ